MKTLILSIVIALAFAVGYSAGVRHAVEDSRVYVANDSVFIEIDGEIYEHG